MQMAKEPLALSCHTGLFLSWFFIGTSALKGMHDMTKMQKVIHIDGWPNDVNCCWAIKQADLTITAACKSFIHLGL